MKIAFIVPSLSNKGPVIVVHTLVKYLLLWGEKVVVYYFDDICQLDFECQTIHITPNTIIPFDDYDIVHSHMYRCDKYLYKWRKHIHRAKTVTTIHQDIFSNLKASYNIIVALIFTPIWLLYIRKINKAIPISDSIKRLYASQVPNIGNVIYNGVCVDYNEKNVDVDVANTISKFKGNSVLIGAYAYITVRKGLDMIISLLYRRKDLKAVIIGEGPAKEFLMKYSKKMNVVDRVLFLPYLKSPYNYLQLIDLYAMPSRSEGFGLAMVEAAYTKTPIICSNIPVFHEIFDESEVNYFELEDIGSLSNAVDRAIKTSKEKSAYAYTKACNMFSGQNMAHNYLSLYKTIL